MFSMSPALAALAKCSRLPALAAELVAHRPNVIIATGDLQNAASSHVGDEHHSGRV